MNDFLPVGELSHDERLARVATLGALVQRLILDGSPDGKDFASCVASVITSEVESVRVELGGGQ